MLKLKRVSVNYPSVKAQIGSGGLAITTLQSVLIVLTASIVAI